MNDIVMPMFLICLGIGGIIGYVMCIYKFVMGLNRKDTTSIAFYGVGIIIPIFGVFFGFIDMTNENANKGNLSSKKHDKYNVRKDKQ